MSRFGSNKYTQNMRKNRETEQVFASRAATLSAKTGKESRKRAESPPQEIPGKKIREDGIRKKNAEKRFRERVCRRYFHKMPGSGVGRFAGIPYLCAERRTCSCADTDEI